MKAIFLTLLVAVMPIAHATKIVCTNSTDKLAFYMMEGRLLVIEKDSQLTGELQLLRRMQRVSVQISSKNWTVATLEDDSRGDTNFLATLVMGENSENIRLSIQVLVNGLEGRTYSKAFECKREL